MKNKIIFLGSGSAFTVGKNNYQSNILLELANGHKMLIDCGTDIRLSLFEQGLNYLDIDAVYISHLHADHVGGLEWLAFTTKLSPKGKKPKLYISYDMVDDIWDKSLSAGLSSFEAEIVTLKTFFDVFPVPKNGSFIWEKISFQLIQSVHAMNGFSYIPTYGLYFTLNNKKIYFTADTQLCLHQYKFYQMADCIFQDCDTNHHKSCVHAHYDDLKKLPSDIKKKMWLYHLPTIPDYDPTQDGFLGFVHKGQKFEF